MSIYPDQLTFVLLSWQYLVQKQSNSISVSPENVNLEKNAFITADLLGTIFSSSIGALEACYNIRILSVGSAEKINFSKPMLIVIKEQCNILPHLWVLGQL